ncbi:MAG: Fe-S protein assembly chaperone HscA [Candidatus Sumerlaeia bacterium]|nr:Fe-S protein assembly chaperone HscA [Candidatus Sumerlaeia bacterium]
MPKVVGIDLGTTNSLVAAVLDGAPRILAPEGGRGIVPSLVGAAPDGSLVVGDAARELMETAPADVVFSAKRLMGRSVEDVAHLLPRLPYQVAGAAGGVLRAKLGRRWMTPPQISAEILAALRDRAQLVLDGVVDKAVVTVPAYFNDAQRQATKDAGALAGLEVLRIVNEPTAACLAYGLQERREGVVAVYDLGGGTFDISILRVRDGVFEVLATNGDTELGGDDIDRAVADRLIERAGAGPMTPALAQAARLAAERAKIALTDADATEALFRADGREHRVPLTRAEFEAIARPIAARTLEPCRKALEDADLLHEEIDEVVLVGGSTRMPLVRRMVGDYFGRAPHTELHPEEVVALGAAVQANILGGEERSLLLLDVTPLSLGIEAYGGIMQTVIPRNTTVPASVTEVVTNFVDGQTHVELHVLQGERDLAAENRSLARFRLGPLPPLPAGLHRIEVAFTLDADGLLSVAAKDQRTGLAQRMEVKPSYGLSDADVEHMLVAARGAAGTDAPKRALIEERLYAEMAVRATEKGISEAGDLIDEIDLIVIEEQLAALKSAMGGEDLAALKAARDRLEGAAQPLAVAMMNAALLRGLKGRRASEVLGAGAAPALTPAMVNPDHQREVAATLSLPAPKPPESTGTERATD